MMKLVLAEKFLKQVRGELCPIVRYESMWNSITAEMLLCGLNDCWRLDIGKFINFIEVTAVIYCYKIGNAI